MAKKPVQEPVGLTKKQASLSHRDQLARTRVLVGIIAGAALVVLLIAAGLIYEYAIKPTAPVATVNGERISATEYQKMVRYQRNNLKRYISNLEAQSAQIDPNDQNNAFMVQYYEQLITQMQSQLTDIGSAVLEEMIATRLIRAGAAEEGITISDEQVTAEIQRQFGYDPNPPTPAPTEEPAAAPTVELTPAAEITATVEPTFTPLPTATPMSQEAFDTMYAQYLSDIKTIAGFDEAEFRTIIRDDLLRAELQKVIGERASATSEQVWARHILVADEATAKTVEEKLAAGGDFAELAKEYSTDTSNKDNGGDLGWFGRGAMITEFEDAAFALGVGQISEPISTTFGYHIIKVEGHEQDHPMEGSALEQAKQQAFDDWLKAAQEKAEIKRTWTADMVPAEPTPGLVQ